jgi:hypothetical protein
MGESYDTARAWSGYQWVEGTRFHKKESVNKAKWDNFSHDKLANFLGNKVSECPCEVNSPALPQNI